MITEKSFKRCYIDGIKAGVATYSNGDSALLYSNIGKFGECDSAFLESLQANGVSLHQFPHVRALGGGDAEAIRAVFGSSWSVDWEGSNTYAAFEAAKQKRPGGRNGGEKPGGRNGGEKPAPGVASSDAFQVPGVDSVPALANILSMLPPAAGDDMRDWAVAVGTSVLDGSERPAVPESLTPFMAMPALPPAVEAYHLTIEAAARDHAEKLAAREAAEKAAREAAEKGKKLITLLDGSTVEVTGAIHPSFIEACTHVKNGIPVYMVGPAGTGKSYCARQIAEALRLDFYESGKMDDIYNAFTGVMMPNVGYMPTPFGRAFTSGAVFLADEIDHWNPDCVAWLQSPLESGRAAFADGSGNMTLQHENFIMLAAGNTNGLGNNPQYPYANQLSPAFRGRFAFVEFGYSDSIDEAAADGDASLLAFARDLRSVLESSVIQGVVCSPREIARLKKANYLPKEKALAQLLVKGLAADTVRMIAAKLTVNNDWSKAFKALAA